MDPYLEDPDLWPDVHLNLILGSQALLSAQLRPKYVVRVEERTYIADDTDETFKPQLRVPDVEVASRTGWEDVSFSPQGEATEQEPAEPVLATTWFEEEIREAFLKIIDRRSRDVVTIIEILSPTNQVPGSPGRASFEQKRREVMYSAIHWVEIDRNRGTRMVRVPKKIGRHEYLVHVSKKGLRPGGLLYPIRLRRPLPVIPIPLKARDPDARLDLHAVLDAAYDRAAYDLEIDYRKELEPPLDRDLAKWSDELLRAKGLR
jgi:hypothetical protein